MYTSGYFAATLVSLAIYMMYYRVFSYMYCGTACNRSLPEAGLYRRPSETPAVNANKKATGGLPTMKRIALPALQNIENVEFRISFRII